MYGQNRLNGRVVDALSQEPLPYASILVGNHGAYTNEEGFFNIELSADADSLSVSFVGYIVQKIAVSNLNTPILIKLQPSVNDLESVTVLANDEYLYNLVSDCRKQLKKWPSSIAKGYFQLATTMDGYPVEVMQTYYNIVASGGGLKELQLKAGRIANHESDSLFYRSLGTSQGLMRIGFADPSQGFAPHLLQLSKSKLRASYQLTNRPDFSDEKTVHIQFDPVAKRSAYFSGELWIDKESKTLQKLILRHDSLTEYPFFPLRIGDELSAFNIELTYTFSDSALQQVQWKYGYNHRIRIMDEPATDRAMFAEGVLLSFDRGNPFYRPRYNIIGEFGDYRKLSFFPYDPLFWATAPSIPLTEKQEKQLAIFADTNSRIDFSKNDDNNSYAAFTRGNLFWQANTRISHLDSSTYYDQIRMQIVDTYFNLDPVVQIFLDINPTADTLRFNSATIFDVFTSDIQEAPSVELNAALNIYFDLCEMIRQEMIADLHNAPRDIENANSIYEAYYKQLLKLKRKFWAEVDRGDNRAKMEYYNDLVLDTLRINNLESYNLYKFAVPENELVPVKKAND